MLDLCFSLHHHSFTMLEERLLDSTDSGATPTSPASQTSLDDRATNYSHTSKSPRKNVCTKCAVSPTWKILEVLCSSRMIKIQFAYFFCRAIIFQGWILPVTLSCGMCQHYKWVWIFSPHMMWFYRLHVYIWEGEISLGGLNIPKHEFL